MTTVLEDADEGSSRASCVFMARSYTGQVLVRNPSAKSVHISASYARLSQETGHVLVRTPGTRQPGFQPQKRAMSGGLNLDFVIDSYAYSYSPTGRYQQLDTRRR